MRHENFSKRSPGCFAGEEMIVAVEGELRIDATTVPTERRPPWPMEDRRYRNHGLLFWVRKL